MKIGISDKINQMQLRFYEQFYDVVPSPNYCDDIRLLKPSHGLTYLGNSSKKICRFCGKDESEVTFKKIAHVFPESIGNKALASYYECDECNNFFGKTIENDYATFFQFYHSVFGIKGKDKIPKIKSNEKVIDAKGNIKSAREIYWDNVDGKKSLVLVSNTDLNMDDRNKTFTFSEQIGKCCPIAVYKAFVKMALSVLPSSEVKYYSGAIDWIKDKKHKNIYYPKKLIVKYEFIPGFNVVKYPHFILYRRKMMVWNLPYLLFNLVYGNFSFLVQIPRDNELKDFSVMNIPMPPIIYNTYEGGFFDLSNDKLSVGQSHSIQIKFENAIDVKDKTNIYIENGKRKIVTKYVRTIE